MNQVLHTLIQKAWPALAVCAVAFVLVHLIKGLTQQRQTDASPLPTSDKATRTDAELLALYTKQTSILTNPEQLFYAALLRASEPYTICPKVRMADFVHADSRRGKKAALWKISQKRVDFLLCRSSDLKPLLAIELDDETHRRKAAQTRDAFVDSVYAAVNLPVLHITRQDRYDSAALAHQIDAVLG